MSGEGATSTGPLVPVATSEDVQQSRMVARVLEGHGIPAIIDSDLDVPLVGLHVPSPPGWAQVCVPAAMRGAALEVIEKLAKGEIQGSSAPPEAPAPADTPAPARRPFPKTDEELEQAMLEALARGVMDDDEDEEEPAFEPGHGPGQSYDAPRRIEVPEPPFAGRLRLALLAVAFGVLVQALLRAWVGDSGLVAGFAARAPLIEELHRLITASFLHGGPMHMFSNAAFGLVFGAVLFGTHRAGATALVWLLSSAVGMGLEITLNPEASVLGASAGNYGLVGLWAHGQLERARLAPLPRREVMATLGVLLLLVPGALTPLSSSGTRIAVIAHIGGFFAGYLAGKVFRRRLLAGGWERIERRSRTAGLLAVSLTAAAWLVGIIRVAF